MRRRFFASDGLNPHFDYNNYLTIEALEDGLSVGFTRAIEYSIDGRNWELLTTGSSTKIINKGEIVSFRAELTSFGGGLGMFTINKACNLKGNVMSMIFGDDAANNNSLAGQYGTFYRMFLDCITIKSVSKNFLPATTLIDSCYDSMFEGCTGLTQAPELPSTNLMTACYYRMFYGCTNLNYIKMLATDISAPNCLSDWVNGVSPTGTFVKSKDATWDVVGDSGVPIGWKIEYEHDYNLGSDISFQINGINEALYAKDWMTWEDWVYSKYNTISAQISSGYIFIPSNPRYPLTAGISDNIIDGYIYYFSDGSGN